MSGINPHDISILVGTVRDIAWVLDRSAQMQRLSHLDAQEERLEDQRRTPAIEKRLKRIKEEKKFLEGRVYGERFEKFESYSKEDAPKK